MKRNIKSPYYEVRWVKTKEFGRVLFPLVYLSNGELSYTLLVYMKHLFSTGVGKYSSGFRDLFRVVGEITYFYYMNKDQHEYWIKKPQELFIEYFSVRLRGTINNEAYKYSNIYWNSVSEATIKKLRNKFQAFQKFCCEYLGVNEVDIGGFLVTYINKFNEFQIKTKYALLSHLMHEFDVGKYSKYMGRSISDEFHENIYRVRQAKYFPPSHVQKLIESECNLNYKAIYLLCAFTGLRLSETLHILTNDIIIVDGELLPQIIMDSPGAKRNGDISYTWDPQRKRKIPRSDVFASLKNGNVDGKNISNVELEYLKNPIPRNMLPEGHPYRSGFKGMTLRSSYTEYGYVLKWTNDTAHILFSKILKELFNIKRLNHKYLFCDKRGAPCKMRTIEKRIERKSKILTGNKYGSHSLRHFCGYYIRNVLNLSITDAQVILRHASIASTQIYYHISNGKFKESLGGKTNEGWDKIVFSTEL